MKTTTLNSIEDVINVLEAIILESEKTHDPLGYFAVLYQKVTKKVKEGIDNDFFDNGPRMEQLDIVFAERYLQAYFAYKNNGPVTASWKRAFELSSTRKPIVLQHLLLGINAHINLDLGIAAAEISRNENIDKLENDFFKINEILSSMVDEVVESLSYTSPLFRIILKMAGKLDNLVVNFIMDVARRKAWKFAKKIVNKSQEELHALIIRRDWITARAAGLIGYPCSALKMATQIVRMEERGSVPDIIQDLRA